MITPDFDEVYQKYFTDVYKYVLSLCHNESIAEEITQETFFKALRKIKQFNGTCTLFSWLCQIAKNTYFSFARKQKKIIDGMEQDISDSSFNLEIAFIDKEAAGRLHALLHNLDEPYKEVFTLRVLGELKFSQIGSLFDKTDSWARLIYYRAKKQLQEAMK